MAEIQTVNPRDESLVALVLKPNERLFISRRMPDDFQDFFHFVSSRKPLIAQHEIVVVARNVSDTLRNCQDVLFIRHVRPEMGHVRFYPPIISELRDVLDQMCVPIQPCTVDSKYFVAYGDEAIVIHPKFNTQGWILTRDHAQALRNTWLRQESTNEIGEVYLFMKDGFGWFYHLNPDILDDPDFTYTIRYDSGSGQIHSIRDNVNWHEQFQVSFQQGTRQGPCILYTQDLLPTRFFRK